MADTYCALAEASAPPQAQPLEKKQKRTRHQDDAALKNFDDLPDAAHVRLPVVAALWGTSEPNVWKWIRLGRIPPGRKLGPQTTAWSVGELRAFLAALAKA